MVLNSSVTFTFLKEDHHGQSYRPNHIRLDSTLLKTIKKICLAMNRDQSRQIPYLLEIALGIRNANDYSYQEWVEAQKQKFSGKESGVVKDERPLTRLVREMFKEQIKEFKRKYYRGPKGKVAP